LSPEIYHYIETLIRRYEIGSSVIELGATGTDDDLIRMESLRNAKVRVALGNGCCNERVDGIQYLKENTNNLACFEAKSFNLVLCNAMLEHDPYFWKTLVEIKRILIPGGLLIIGVPGFEGMGVRHFFPKNRLLRRLLKLSLLGLNLNYLKASTPTLGVHAYPEDYYRFSATAVRNVLFEGYEQVNISSMMIPPRIVAIGIRKDD